MVPAGLRNHEIRTRIEAARRRRGRPLPDADLCAVNDCDQLARQGERHRLLRRAGDGPSEEWRDNLDARRYLHPQDDHEPRCGQGLPGLHRLDCRR